MKKKLFSCLAVLLATACIGGCAYNQMTITADNGSTVTCTGTVDKPTNVDPAIQGNVPVQGGSVINPSQTQTTAKP